MPAELEISDQYGDGGRAGALVAGWLAAKRSPHTRAAYLRDLAQWADWSCTRARRDSKIALVKWDHGSFLRRLRVWVRRRCAQGDVGQ
jgi:hypothetical protein